MPKALMCSLRERYSIKQHRALSEGKKLDGGFFFLICKSKIIFITILISHINRFFLAVNFSSASIILIMLTEMY